MAARPVLRQFGDLTEQDLIRSPVWISVHGEDSGEPWYDDEDVDEETFRPYRGPRPVSAHDGLLLVRALAQLGTGARVTGFLTPSHTGSLGEVQPYLFAGGRQHGFWRATPPTRAALLADLGMGEHELFPVAFTVPEALATGVGAVVLDGWPAS